MPISFSKYVDITSAVGGAAQAAARELILRLMTSNELIPTGSVVEFESAADVGDYFGTTSDEFTQAQFYFAFISKLATTPTKISFARFSLVDTAPQIFGENKTFAVSDFDSIADGTFEITFGAITQDVLVNFTTGPVTSLTEVATAIEAAIQAADAAAVYTGATVAFNAIDSRFELTGGATGDFLMDIAPTGSGTDITALLGWVDPPARFSDGIVGTTLTAFLIAQDQLTNNFGSFAFIDIPADNASIVEIATWNDGENVKFIYLERTTLANAATLAALVDQLGGVGLTIYDAALLTDYPWLLPGSIMAATPYTRRASVQNYMFQQASLASLVTDTPTSTSLDSIAVNYYGETQQAGSLLVFYQRGFLQGLATDPIDMGVYANEVFLKDSIGVAIINLLLAVSAVPANSSGLSQVLGVIQAPIDLSLFNGTISIGKTLNATQQAFVTAITGDATAFVQIQNSGYWITAAIEEPQPNEFVVEYILLYSKNDTVRKVEGSHLLI